MEILIISACIVVGVLLVIILHRPCIVISRILTRSAQTLELEMEIEAQKERNELREVLRKLKAEQNIVTNDDLYDILEGVEEKEQC